MWSAVRYIFFPLVCVIFVSCFQNKPKDKSDGKNDINELLQMQAVAWNQGNIKGFMAGYDHSDSLQFITRRGRTMGWQSVLDNYIKHYPTKKEMGELHFKNLVIKQLSDSLAQAYGNWELKKDSAVGGNFSLILKNKPEGWKIIIDHTW